MDKCGAAIAVAHRDSSIETMPFLNFTSGYVERAVNLLPKQGVKRPWQVYQNYLQDWFSIRHGRVADGILRFGRAGKLP
jgi:cyclohexanone monooxygenase